LFVRTLLREYGKRNFPQLPRLLFQIGPQPRRPFPLIHPTQQPGQVPLKNQLCLRESVVCGDLRLLLGREQRVGVKARVIRRRLEGRPLLRPQKRKTGRYLQLHPIILRSVLISLRRSQPSLHPSQSAAKVERGHQIHRLHRHALRQILRLYQRRR
jgi:hypothetical protein